MQRWQIDVEELPKRFEAHPGENLLLFYMSNQRESNSFRNSSVEQKNRSQKIKSVPVCYRIHKLKKISITQKIERKI